MLYALKETEQCHKDNKGFSFLSSTTLKAMRFRLISTIRLTEELLTKFKLN